MFHLFFCYDYVQYYSFCGWDSISHIFTSVDPERRELEKFSPVNHKFEAPAGYYSQSLYFDFTEHEVMRLDQIDQTTGLRTYH